MKDISSFEQFTKALDSASPLKENDELIAQCTETYFGLFEANFHEDSAATATINLYKALVVTNKIELFAQLIKKLTSNFSQEKHAKIISVLLKCLKAENFSEIITKEILEPALKTISSEKIFDLIISIKDENKKPLFSLLEAGNFYLSEKDFFKLEDTPNLVLFSLLLSNNYLNEDNTSKEKFFADLAKSADRVLGKILESNLCLRDLLVFRNHYDVLKLRIQKFSLNNPATSEAYFEYINSNFEKCLVIKEKVEKLQRYFETLSSSSPNLEKVEKMDRFIQEVPFNQLQIESGKIKEVLQLYTPEVEKKIQLLDSSCFINILASFSKKFTEQHQAVNCAISAFETLGLFIEKKEKFTYDFFITYFNGFNQAKIEKELNFAIKLLSNNQPRIDVKEEAQKIYLITQKKKIFDMIRSMGNLLMIFSIPKTSFIEEYYEVKKLFEKQLTQKEVDTIAELFSKLQLVPIQGSRLSSLIMNLVDKKELVEFVKDKTEEEFISLREGFLTSEDDSEVSEIQKLIQITNFFKEVQSQNPKDDKEFFEMLEAVSQKEEYKTLEESLAYISKNFTKVRERYTEDDSKEKEKDIINLLYNGVSFKLVKLDSLLTYIVEVDNVSYFYDFLLLQTDAVLVDKKADPEFKKVHQEITEFFIKLNQVIKLTKKLEEKGIKLKGEVSIEFPSQKVSTIEEKTKQNLANHILLLKCQVEEFNQMQNTFYVRRKGDTCNLCNEMSFVYGKNFEIFEEKLFEGKGDIDKLLAYIVGKKVSYEVKKLNPYRGSGNIWLGISQFLTETLAKNNITEEQIFQKAIISKNFSLDPIFLTKTKKDSVEIYLLQSYSLYTNNLPIPQVVLMCSEETKKEEVVAFLHRAFYSKVKGLFSVVTPEKLEERAQRKFVKCLKELKRNQEKEMQASLNILIVDSSKKLYNDINKYISKSPLELSDKSENFSNLINLGISIVSSDDNGYGKSSYIKEKVGSSNYFYFPINTTQISPTVLDGMSEKLSSDTPLIIHFDVNSTTCTPTLKDFFFKVLVLRHFFWNDALFILNESTEIFIELPSKEYKNQFNFFSLLKEVVLSYEDEISSIISFNPSSAIKIIDNFWKVSKSNRIDKVIMCSKDFETPCSIPTQKPEKETTRNFIEEFYAVQFSSKPNLYQLVSLVRKFSEELIHFATNPKLTPENLSENFPEIKGILFTYLVQLMRRLSLSYIDDGEDFSSKMPEVMTSFKSKNSIEVINIKSNEKVLSQIKFFYYFCFENDPASAFIDVQTLNSQELYSEKIKIALGVEDKEGSSSQKKFIFTKENFVKMVFINKKIELGYPIILMGERGTGKTTIVKKLAQMKGYQIFSFNMIEEIDENDIFAFFKGNFLLESQKTTQNQKALVFLKGINMTCLHGTVKEVFCNRTIIGNKIRQDVTIVGSCYPLRTNGTDVISKLPSSLLNFVVNLGKLHLDDFQQYLQVYTKAQLKDLDLEDFFPLVYNSIVEIYKLNIFAFNYRDVKRVFKIFKWLQEYYRIKESSAGISQKDSQNVLKAIVVSFHICYSLQLKKREEREEFGKKIEKIIGNIFFEYVKEEEDFLFSQMTLPKGVVKTKSLSQNILALFVCVLTQIPALILGSPGTSKMTAIKTLEISLKGEKSNSKFLKEFPPFINTTYYGSSFNSQNEIKKLFNKARSKTDAVKNLISAITYKQMSFKPERKLLKFFKKELISKKGKLQFIGLSTQKAKPLILDKFLTIFSSEPDNEEILDIATSISQLYLPTIKEPLSAILKAFASAFNDYREANTEQFHGLIDFISLIKDFSRGMSELISERNEHDTHTILQEALVYIDKNFGGFKASSESRISSFEFKKLFRKYCSSLSEEEIEKENTLNCIEKNLKSSSTRFMLLISDTKLSKFIISEVNKKVEKKEIFIVGNSIVKEDEAEIYSLKIIKKIRKNLSEKLTLTLESVDEMLPLIYDLLSQHYIYIGRKKFIRLSSPKEGGAVNFVNNEFSLIITMRELKKEDSFFSLHQLEKQILSFDFFLSESHVNLALKIYHMLHSITTLPDNKFFKGFSLTSQIINYDLEEIKGIIYFLSQKQITSEKDISEKTLKLFIQTFSQDIIWFLNFSDFSKKNNAEVDLIRTTYEDNHFYNFETYLSSLEKGASVVYTYSSVFHELQFNEIQSKSLGKVTPKMVMRIYVGNFKKEGELKNEIKSFYSFPFLKVLIIHFNEEGLALLDYVSSIVNSLSSTQEAKTVIFLIHKPTDSDSTQKIFLSHLSNYPQHFIDNLSGKHISLPSTADVKEFFNSAQITNLLKEKIKNIFASFHYKFIGKFVDVTEEGYKSTVLSVLLENEKIFSKYKECVVKSFLLEFPDLTPFITKSKISSREEPDFLGSLNQLLENKIDDCLRSTLISCEEDGLLFKASFKLEEEKGFEWLDSIFEDPSSSPTQTGDLEITTLPGMKVFNSYRLFREIEPFLRSVEGDFLHNIKKIKLIHTKNNSSLDKEKELQTINQKIVADLVKNLDHYKHSKIREIENNKEIFNEYAKDYFKYYISRSSYFLGKGMKVHQDSVELLSKIYLDDEEEKSLISFATIIINLRAYSNYIYPLILILSEAVGSFPEIKAELDGFIEKEKKYFSSESTLRMIFQAVNQIAIKCFENLKDISDPLGSGLFLFIQKIVEINYQANAGLYLNLPLAYALKLLKEVSNILLLKKNEFSSDFFVFYNSIISEMSLYQKLDSESAEEVKKTLLELLDQQLDFLTKNLLGGKEFSEVLQQLFSMKLKLSKAQDIRRKILVSILEKRSYILYCNSILFKILKEELNQKESSSTFSDFDSILSNSSTDLLEIFESYLKKESLKTSKSYILHEVILLFFQLEVESFFIRMNASQKEKEYTSLGNFEKAIKYINNYSSGNSKIISLIYYVSYVKVYLYNYIQAILTNKNFHSSSLMSILKNSENNYLYDYLAKSLTFLQAKNSIKEVDLDFHELSFLKDYMSKEEEKIPNSSDQESVSKLFKFTEIFTPQERLLSEINQLPEVEKKNYLVLTSFFAEKEKIDKLQNILKINPFANGMIEKYSHNITREKARTTSIKEGLSGSDSEEFQDFKEAFNLLSDCTLKYFPDKEASIKIDEDTKLAYALNDENDTEYGMHLAALYKEFISWQNFVLDEFGSKSVKHEIAILKNEFESEMLSQDASSFEVVCLETPKFMEKICSTEEIINLATYRPFLFNDQNYEKLRVNLRFVEEELSKFLLLCKRKFKKDQKTVVYSSEG